MKVLFVTNNLSGGGAEKLLNDMLPVLKKDNYDVSVLILSDKNEKYLESLKNNGISVFILPKKIKTHCGKIRYIRHFATKNKFQIVHANCFPSFYYCAIAKKMSKKFPLLVLTEHNTDNRRRHKKIFKPIEKWIYSEYDWIISISRAVQDNLIRWISKKDDKNLSVVDNGVPVELYKNSVAYDKNIFFQNLNAKDILISMVASFTEQKNHAFAVDILNKLPPFFKLVFVGDGPLKTAIEEKVYNMDLNSRVVFLGFRKDAGSIMKSCDISFIPSKWEGFGLVAVEAMACGKPIVASNVPGLNYVVGDSGILCDVDNQNAFIDAFLKLENNDVRERYASKAMERACLFDLKYMVKKYESIYENIANH